MNNKAELMQRFQAALFWVLVLGVTAGYTTLGVRRFLHATNDSEMGDFPVFHDAFVAVRTGEDLYASGIGGYIYPPLFAALFSPLGALSVQTAGALFAVMNGALLLLCLGLICIELVKRFRAEGGPALLPAMMLLTIGLFADKVLSEIKLGQTDLLVLTALILSLRWIDHRPILVGILLGFAGNIKYQSIIFLPYLLLRRRWRALISAVVSSLACAMSTMFVFGWERNLDYLRRAFGGLVRMMGGEYAAKAANVHDLTWIRSISFPSISARVVEWAGWPDIIMLGLTGVLALICLGFVILLYWRNGHAVVLGRGGAFDHMTDHGRALAAIEWVGLLVAILVFSPQTTTRHLVLMIPLGSLAAMLILVQNQSVRRLPVLVAAVFLLLALILPPGGAGFERSLYVWRWVGGVSFVTLVLLFVTIASSLRWAKTLPEPVVTVETDDRQHADSAIQTP